jgi:hypothetical protein
VDRRFRTDRRSREASGRFFAVASARRVSLPSGRVAAYMAGRFRQGEAYGLHVSTPIGHASEVSRVLFQYRQAYYKFDVG